MNAIEEIAAERRRQVEQEGWSVGHDDRHDQGELAAAAAGYAYFAAASDKFRADFRHLVPKGWPWAADWWKPKDRRRDLVRAAALIVAEIERLDRLPAHQARRDDSHD